MNITELNTIYTRIMGDAVNSKDRYTSDLDKHAAKVHYVGRNKVKYNVIEGGGFVNLGDNVLNLGLDGSAKTNPTQRYKEGTLEYRRAFEDGIDEQAFEELGYKVVMSDLLEAKKLQMNDEIDKVRLAEIAEGAGSQKEAKLTKANVLSEISKAILNAKSKTRSARGGELQNIIVYVSDSTFSLLGDSMESKIVQASSDKSQAIYTEIYMIDGVKVVPVPNDLMVTNLDNEKLMPTETSKQIDFIVVPYKSVATPVVQEEDTFKVFEPGNGMANAFGYGFVGSYLHGVFILEGRGRKESITANLSEYKPE